MVVVRPGEQREAVPESFRERDFVEAVLLVAAQRVTRRVRDRGSLPVAPVVHVPAVATGGPQRPDFDALGGHELLEKLPRLAPEGGAHDHRDVERGDHPCLPDALATSVHM